MSDKEPTSVNLRKDHKDKMDARNINRSSLINDLLDKYFNGSNVVDEAVRDFRKRQLRSEIQNHENQLEQLESELSRIATAEEKKQSRKEERIDELIDGLLQSDGTLPAEHKKVQQISSEWFEGDTGDAMDAIKTRCKERDVREVVK